MQIIVLQADKSDLPAILQLQKACYMSEAEIYNDYAIPPLRQDIGALESEFAKLTFLKAVADNEIVGSVRAFSDGTTCFVGKLIVKAEFQNRGIGRLLLEAIETCFPDCKRFELFTGHKSSKNLYLYRKIGYKEFGKEDVNNNITMIYLGKYNKKCRSKCNQKDKMSIDKTEILQKLCYTELVYERINKKLRCRLSKPEIEALLDKVIQETSEAFFKCQGKNVYISNREQNIRITVNLNTFRVITVDWLNT